MKTILNLSLVLMLIGGSAGAVNFYKMFKSGEIETLYSHEAPALAHASASAPVCKHPTPEKPMLETIRENLETVKLDPEDYSRGIIEPEIRTVEELQPTVDTTAIEIAEATIAQPSHEFVKMVVTETPQPIAEASIITTNDEVRQEEPRKTPRKIKFKASMFSRSALVEEPIEFELDSIATTSVDTLSN